MTTITQTMAGTGFVPSGTASGGGGATGSRANDGYGSLQGSLIRNTLVGAGAGAIAGATVGMPLPGAAIGAAAGAGSALIRNPTVASVAGDALKGATTGIAGGAVIGMATPLTPIGGMIVGGVSGATTGIVNGLLKNVAGGKLAHLSIDAEKTLWGRLSKGAAMGGITGAAVGAGVGAMFGGVGAVPGALVGGAIGALGGAFQGFMTGTVDAATGAKGVKVVGPQTSGLLPDLGGRGSGHVHQSVSQSSTNGESSPPRPGGSVQQSTACR